MRLRGRSERKAWLALAAGGIGVLALPFTGMSIYLMSVAFLVMFHATLAISWNILGGYAGYGSFGHSAFVGVGAYTTALLLSHHGLSPLLIAPVGGLLAAAVALLIGYPCLRLRGPYFALVTLVVSLAVSVVVINLPGLNIASGVFVPRPAQSPVMSRFILYEAMAVILIVTVLVARGVERSRFGVALAAIREDEEVAATQGVPTTRFKLTAFVVSAALTGFAGGIFSWSRGFLDPGDMFSVHLSVLIVLFALFGGRRSWVGPLLGALVVTVSREFLFIVIGEDAAQILFGVLLVIVILFMPNGLIGTAPRLFKNGATP